MIVNLPSLNHQDQDGSNVVDDKLNTIFLNEKLWFSISAIEIW